MKTRRPLCCIFAAYALGIGCVIFLWNGDLGAALLFPLSAAFAVIVCTVILHKTVKETTPKPNASHIHAESLTGTAVSVFPIILAVCFLIGALGCAHGLAKEDPLTDDAAKAQRVTVLGTAIKVDVRRGKSDRITLRSEGRDVLLTVAGEDLDPAMLLGMPISFCGLPEVPENRRNPGLFDYRNYLKSKGIRINIIGSESDLSIAGESGIAGKFYNNLGKFKYEFMKNAAVYMDPDGFALFSGMMFGDDSLMEDDIKEMFRENGVAHILCVSGLHVGIVYAFINILFGRRRSLSASMAAIAALIVYALLSEFSPSVIRAVVMIGLHIISKLCKLRYDLLTGTCFAALLMLLSDPLKLLDPGFRLSFLAVAILAFLLPLADRVIGYRDRATENKLSAKDLKSRRIESTHKAVRDASLKAVLTPAVIQTGMGIYTAYSFNYFSPAAVLLNIPVVAIAGMILPVGILMAILNVLEILLRFLGVSGFASLDTLFGIAAGAANSMCHVLLKITEIVNAMPASHFVVVSPPVIVVFIFYGLGFFFCSETFPILVSRHRKRMIVTVSVLLIFLSFMVSLSPSLMQNRSALTFVDVGQGDCLHIRTPDGKNYLIDGGGRSPMVFDAESSSAGFSVGKSILLPYLLKNGVGKLDGVFVTHLHQDHFGGIRELSNYMDIGKVYIYEANRVIEDKVISDSGIKPEDIRYIAAGDSIILGKDVILDVLYPMRADDAYYRKMTGESEDENATSLLLKVNYNDITVLMTADLGFDAEETVTRQMKALIGADILKVGHHGSKFSTSDKFLKAVSPKIAVIQVGKNTFGHPTAEVLEKIRVKGIMMYRNDRFGAVRIDITKGKHGQEVRINTCLPGDGRGS